MGVAQSLTGRHWTSRPADDRQAIAIAQRLGVPEIVGRVLAARDVTCDGAEAFLKPSLRRDMPDPGRLKDMDKAVARTVAAILRGDLIALFGDYDVDGATSVALLDRFLRAVGGRVTTYVPDRIKEGYGPNTPALARLHAQGATVAITMDCGISAHEPLAAARDLGLDVIVIDHHLPGADLPPAAAVIDPNRLDEPVGLGQLAAVGVTFLFAVAVNRALRDAGRYRDRPEPDLREWLDLVALGTVCDAVPLTGLNRALVTQGLRTMGRRGNVGLAALADVAHLDAKPGAYHLGFILGPRINAGGRVGEPDLGVRLLTTDDPIEARGLAERLDGYNAERRTIEAAVLVSAEAAARARGGAIAFAAGEGWHPGVVGIVASRLVERMRRPAFVVGIADGVGRGSGRSIPGVDIGAAVIAARQAGLLVNGGGHPMAAGITVDQGRLEGVAAFLEQRLGPAATAAGGTPTLMLDGALAVGAVTGELMNLVEQAGPFGTGNAEPRFAVRDCHIGRADVVGGQHVRCFVTGIDGSRLKAIAFRAVDTPLGRALLTRGGPPLHLAGTVRSNPWQGETSVQLVIDDVAAAT
ncbi:MAG: single-stranded-DNA-specific exonuclease RecJ [Alphaproteobacteria bacterium]|nr:single-stranded-DNA-specific exonuclease RecJ [Alphaproteobacteria bacterium]